MTDDELSNRISTLLTDFATLEAHGVPGHIAGKMFVDWSDVLTELRMTRKRLMRAEVILHSAADGYPDETGLGTYWSVTQLRAEARAYFADQEGK